MKRPERLCRRQLADHCAGTKSTDEDGLQDGCRPCRRRKRRSHRRQEKSTAEDLLHRSEVNDAKKEDWELATPGSSIVVGDAGDEAEEEVVKSEWE